MHVVSLLFHDVYARNPGESGFSSAAADRYKLSLAEFDAQLAGVASARADAPVMATDLLARQSEGFSFSITVDDGGVSYYTVIADRLEALGWRGHCFVSTDLIGTPGFLTASQIRELDARGHVIGSHTASHPYRFSARPPEEMRREWSRSRTALEDVVGHPIVAASVPGGFFSRTVARTAYEEGLRVLFTSEPVTSIERGPEGLLIGRFSLRAGARPDASARLVCPPPWARLGEWTSWNAKGIVKPLLGNSFVRVADWVHARKPAGL